MSARALIVAVAAFVLVPGVGRAASDVNVRATVDRNRVALGEPIGLSIEVSGTQGAGAPNIDNLDGFQVQYLGPASQVSIVNGQMSASVTHRYRLFAQRTGRFTVGPFQVEVNGQRYATERIAIEVSAAPAAAQGQNAPGGQPGRDDLRLVLSLPRDELYVGERVPLEVVLYVGNVRVDDLQFPAVAGDGVVVDKLTQPTRRDEVVGGRRVQALHFATNLSALRPGPVQLSATMGMNTLVSRRRRGGDAFFDQFFSDAFADKRPIELHAEARSLTILALPDQGRPPDFGGAVGHFLFDARAMPVDLNAGDPVTVRMAVSGDGDLSRVTAPPINVDDRFRKYDAQLSKDGEAGDRKVFEQVLVPRQAGSLEIPALKFSYFDPEKKAYETITQGPFPISVHAAAVAEQPKIVAQSAPGQSAQAPEKLGRDIVYIKDMPGTLGSRGGAFYRSGWFIAVQLLPPLGFAVLLVAVRRRERFAADPRLVRFRRAGREARRLLADLESAAAENAFYDRLTAAVHGYLGAKLDLPPGAVERARVLDQLGSDGASSELRQSVGELFDLLERARYAPSASRVEQADAALGLARGIVDRLERQRSAPRWLAAAALLVLACAASAQIPDVADEHRPTADAHTAFFAGNAAYKEGRYEEAARAYEEALRTGVGSGALYFNLGNAYFKLGRVGEAILDYERARRFLPRDPDVRANLNYARESVEGEADAPPLWMRLAFPLADRATTGELALVACLLWVLLWGTAAAAVALLRWRAPVSRALWALLAMVAFSGANLWRRIEQTELTPRSVVVAAGETPVRFEPSATGTEHFRVREGTVLEVTEGRDGWYQVRRADGRRGWVAAESLALVDGPAKS